MIASKRMFASSVVESDQFLDMPGTSQLLYFHLGMRADNDGVVDSSKQIMRIIGAADGDMRVLVEAGYVIVMPDSRIIVITDWRVNNNGLRFDSEHNTHGRYYELIRNLETGTDRKHYLREPSGRSPVVLREPSGSSPGDLPETYRGEQNKTTENNGSDVNEEQQQDKIEQIIKKYKVQKTVAVLAKQGYGKEQIEAGLMLLNAAKNVKKPGAWLRRAVEEGWTNPETDREREARRANEAAAAAAREAREQDREEAVKEGITAPYLKAALQKKNITIA